jgi:hypothetical protein
MRSERARAVLGILAGLGVTALGLLDASHAHGLARPVGTVLSALFVLVVVALRVRRLELQLVARSAVLMWLGLSIVAACALLRYEPALVAALSAVLLATARDLRFRSEAAGAQFAPVAYRETFLHALVAQGALALFLALVGVSALLRGGPPPWLGATLLVTAAVLVAGSVAIFRLRAWGLIASVVATLALVTLGVVTMVGRGRFGLPFLVVAPIPLAMLIPVVRARLAR